MTEPMPMADERFIALVPEIALAVAAVLGLLMGSYLPRSKQWLVAVLATAACLTGLVAAVLTWTSAETVFGASYAIDVATQAARVAVLLGAALVLGLARVDTAGSRREAEFYVLVLLAALGSILIAGANDLMLLFAAYLLASLPLYALAGFFADPLGTEAALKYYLMGALSGIVMLAGATLLYGVGGALTYPDLAEGLSGAPAAAVGVGAVALLAGLLFKIGGVPLQFWVPDVTEGSRISVAAFVTTIPKVGALIAAYRFAGSVLDDAALEWRTLLAVVAAATMTLGNLAAFQQRTVRRLLAYSTISQVGYVLMAVAAAGRSNLALSGLLFYVLGYAVTNLAAFATVAALPGTRDLTDNAGLARVRPLLAIALLVSLLGLVGTPPTAVFVAKVTVFTAAIDAGYAWLAVVAALNTVASLFYYLRWIVPVFQRPSSDETAAADSGIGPGTSGYRWAARWAVAAATASLVGGALAGPILSVLSGELIMG